MTEPVPEGPTDPSLSAVEDNTTLVTPPGYGPPISPASPPGPLPGPPPGPPGLPPTELATERFGGGRVYTSSGETQVSGGPPPPPPPSSGRGQGNERGKTTIADEVVERVIDKVVNITVEEAAGVHGLHIAADSEQPVAVTLDGDEATIDITVDVDFGHAVHDVVEDVRSNVISQSERLLGLTVTEVNVLVADVNFDVIED